MKKISMKKIEECLMGKICPSCGSEKIRYFGTGTQRLEQEIIKQFPRSKNNKDGCWYSY